MANAEAILAQLRSARLFWVRDLPALPVPVAMQFDTPSIQQAAHLGGCNARNDLDGAAQVIGPLLRGWEGVTEALVLGAGVGSDAPVPPSGEILTVLLASRPEWVHAIVPELVSRACAERERVKAVSGNSEPSSTS